MSFQVFFCVSNHVNESFREIGLVKFGRKKKLYPVQKLIYVKNSVTMTNYWKHKSGAGLRGGSERGALFFFVC